MIHSSMSTGCLNFEEEAVTFQFWFKGQTPFRGNKSFVFLDKCKENKRDLCVTNPVDDVTKVPRDVGSTTKIYL